MKILTASQIKELDIFTIENEPIASLDLMERASRCFVNWFVEHYDSDREVHIICGPGNNGGDGLAISRMLFSRNYKVYVYLFFFSDKSSKDFKANMERLPRSDYFPVDSIRQGRMLPEFGEKAVVIDAILGSGLNKPVRGFLKEVIEYLNKEAPEIVSVDVPSGMFTDKPTEGLSIEAGRTFTFELPKLGFMFASNQHRVGRWSVGSIGLHRGRLKEMETPYRFILAQTVKAFYRPRKKFAHKGSFGKALLIAGSKGMMGAALLAGRACLRSGAGILTLHSPKCGYQIIQSVLPEALVSIDSNENNFSSIPSLEKATAIGIGCGLGKAKESAKALKILLKKWTKPLVIDADALNLIAENPELISLIPQNSILTPHLREFERLFGETKNDFELNRRLRAKAKELKFFIILKGAHSCVATPEGLAFFNSTGNPGMASGGSGDVLTGVLTGLLAQNYSSEEAAIMGVFLHGLAADIAVKDSSEEALLAGDVPDYLGKAFRALL